MESTENNKQVAGDTVDAAVWASFPFDYVRPEWLPDWQNPEKYKDHGDDMSAWAWECLRRNPKYQADYARWAALPDTDGEGIKSRKYKLTFGDWERMAFFYANPPALSDDETVAEYEQRTGVQAELLQVHLCRKWGLELLEDPSKNDPCVIWQFADTPLLAPFELECSNAQEVLRVIYSPPLECGIGREVIATVRMDLGRDDDPTTRSIDTRLASDDYRIFAFDLRVDPEQQTAEVLAILRQYRANRQKKTKQKSGAQLSKMIQRLRVFDATLTLGNGKQAYIGQVIFGRNADSIVSTDLSTAKRLILDNGYREFLAR